MSGSQAVTYTILCIIPGLANPFPVTVENNKTVEVFKNEIKKAKPNDLASIDTSHLVLYLIDIPEDDRLQENVKQLDNPRELNRTTEELSDVFPETPKKKTIHILIEVPKIAVKRKHDGDNVDDTEPPPKRVEIEERERALSAARNKPLPSGAAKSKDLNLAQRTDPILNGRSFSANGPPITIYESVFSDFIDMNKGEKSVLISSEDYKYAKEFVKASSDIYVDKKTRDSCITPPLQKLLGRIFYGLTLEDGTSIDGVIVGSHRDLSLLLIREMKNELGSKGDPCLQVGYSYTRWWASDLGSYFRSRTCCPSFLLAIAGAWVGVQGGILAGGSWIVQPLTDLVWAGVSHDIDGQIVRIARLFCSLRSGIQQLNLQFEDAGKKPKPSLPPCFPYIASYLDEITNKEETIVYNERIHCGPGREATAMFSATLENHGRLFIKFVTRYNAEAHRLLAEKGYAPQLRHSERIADGIYTMVVMDQLDGFDMHGKSFDEEDLLRIKEAKDLLHRGNYVFGDLRPNNIFKPSNGRGVVLVDFDWCGEDSKDTYPPVVNEDPKCNWHPEVKGGAIMRKDHDDHLFGTLQPNPMQL